MNISQNLLKQVDQINDQISKLDKEKQFIYQRLSALKKQVEKNHAFLIGRKAVCIHSDSKELIECTCTAVMALDDYSSVKPLFSRGGRKIIIESYEWIA